MATHTQIANGTRVRLPNGIIGTVGDDPAFTATGWIAPVLYDTEFAHLSPVGGANYNVKEMTVISDTTEAPRCTNTGCTREASYDSESEGYFSTCDRCTTHPAAGLHAHRQRFTAAQAAANGGPREWTTSYYLRPVITDDEITAWECRHPLSDGSACGYTISAQELAARRAESERISPEDIR